MAAATQTEDSAVPNVDASSRQRFEDYRRRVREGTLPRGSVHSRGESRAAKDRVRSAGQLIRRFLGLLGPYRWSFVGILGSLTVSTALNLIPPAGTKFVVDNVLGKEPLPDAVVRLFPSLTDPMTLLATTVLIVIAVSLTRILIHILGRWYATRITKRIQLSVRTRVFEHAVRLPLHRVQELRSGGVASILREDGGSIGELVFGLIYNPWRAVIQLIGSLVILSLVDWKLLLGALILVPTVFLTHRAWIARIRPQFRAVRKQRENIDGGATETFAGIRIVRAFSRQQRESLRFTTENNLMARQELYAWWWMRVVEMVWEIMIPLSSAGLLFYGGYQVLHGTLTTGDLMMFLVYLLMLLQPLATLAQSATQVQNSLSGLDRVLDLLEEDQEMHGSAEQIRIKKQNVVGSIEFRSVSFAYPGSEHAALQDISLKAEPGETVALVGPSGAGKTTLCNLVARFYDPDEGCVLLDGTDLTSIDVESFRGLLGVVEQDVFLFDGTIRRNLIYGNREASDAEVRRALEAANAAEFIDRLKDGTETVIGERGVRLSGGQRQRLAIARAILADPRILILDEATSNLDTESERLIQKSLTELMRGRTCFVIAHRLSTIAGADRIVVIESGRISQVGTHESLMQTGGRYRDMVQQQVQMTLGKAGEDVQRLAVSGTSPSKPHP